MTVRCILPRFKIQIFLRGYPQTPLFHNLCYDIFFQRSKWFCKVSKLPLSEDKNPWVFTVTIYLLADWWNNSINTLKIWYFVNWDMKMWYRQNRKYYIWYWQFWNYDIFYFILSKFDIGGFEILIFDIDPPLPGPYNQLIRKLSTHINILYIIHANCFWI